MWMSDIQPVTSSLLHPACHIQPVISSLSHLACHIQPVTSRKRVNLCLTWGALGIAIFWNRG